MELDIDEIEIKLQIKADSYYGIHTSGTVYCYGKIKEIKQVITFLPVDDKQHFPMIKIELFDIGLDGDSWHIDVDFKYIPSWLIDWIIKLFKSKILDAIVPKVA